MKRAANSATANANQMNVDSVLSMFRRHHSRCMQFLLISVTGILITSCAAHQAASTRPPLLTQEQIDRPYTKLAVVQVTRERYGANNELSADDYNWANEALREEAAKIGADAVILPEVRIDASSYLLFPSSQVNARGIAIRFP